MQVASEKEACLVCISRPCKFTLICTSVHEMGSILTFVMHSNKTENKSHSPVLRWTIIEVGRVVKNKPSNDIEGFFWGEGFT